VSAAHAGGAARQHLVVTESEYRLDAPGLQGCTPVSSRSVPANTAAGEDGLVVLRLKHPMSDPQVAPALDSNKLGGFDGRGGVAVVPPHGSWEGTLELSAGRYVILSAGSNRGKRDYRRGMIHGFTVGSGGARGTPPDAGKITMFDYAFGISLPHPFDGKGIVIIPNRGTHLHEITFIKTPPGKTSKDVLALIHSNAPPPVAYEVHELLGGLDPGHHRLGPVEPRPRAVRRAVPGRETQTPRRPRHGRRVRCVVAPRLGGG
jgi:hypothetical protein